METYAGVDWASNKHDVLVADAAGEKLLATTFAHDEKGLRSLCRELVRLKVRLVAVERPDGLMVERLLDAGLRVLALHPNQVAAARDRFRVSGGKSDRFDSFVLCELARTDHHRFRVLEPDSDQTKALRALTRGREDLVGTRTALVNQLRAELERFWPGPLRLFSDLHSKISLAFLARYPSPADARGLGEARLQTFLARERYSGRQQPAQLLFKLRQAPEARVGELELATRRALVLSFVAMLKTLNGQIKALEREITTQASGAPRRADLPVAVQERRKRRHRRRTAGRDRRLPRALPDPRRAVRRRRPVSGRDRVGQAQDRAVSLGVQQTAPAGVLHAGRQHPPLAPLRRGAVRRRDRCRPRPPPRDPHRRPLMVARRVALLAGPDTV